MSSIYESPVRSKNGPTKESFYTHDDPRMHTHIYRTHKKDVRHMKTDRDLLAHKEFKPTAAPATKQEL